MLLAMADVADKASELSPSLFPAARYAATSKMPLPVLFPARSGSTLLRRYRVVPNRSLSLQLPLTRSAGSNTGLPKRPATEIALTRKCGGLSPKVMHRYTAFQGRIA
jgi:hypothetical protein